MTRDFLPFFIFIVRVMAEVLLRDDRDKYFISKYKTTYKEANLLCQHMGMSLIYCQDLSVGNPATKTLLNATGER